MTESRKLQSDELKLKIKNTLKRFNYQHIMNHVESIFAVSPKRVKSTMMKYKLPPTKASLIDFILYHIRDFEVHDLQQRLV